jgi:hypothetical protein
MGLVTSPPRPRLADPKRTSSPLCPGVQSTSAAPAAPLILGTCNFDPNRVVLPAFSYAQAWLRAVLEVTDPAATAHLDLYDLAGVTNGGTPAVVANSEMQSSSVTPTFLELSVALSGITGVFQARLWVTGGSHAQAICSSATLDYDWS